MALVAPFERPYRLSSVDAGARARVTPASPLAPFPNGGAEDDCLSQRSCRPVSVERQRSVLEFIVPTLLAEVRPEAAVIARLEACVDEQVVVWSPSLYAASRMELVSALVDGDDALSDVSVSTGSPLFAGHSVVVEWALVGRFDRAAFLNDDVLIDASGSRVETSGVMILSFFGSRVGGVRCYYDGLALLEQLLCVRPGVRPQGDA